MRLRPDWPNSTQFPRRPARHTLRPRIALLLAGVLLSYAAPPTVHAQGVDATTAVHFLEQASFGPTALEVTNVQAIGPYAWIQQQFAIPESPMPDGLDGNGVRSQLYLNMATGPDQLRQRMMFALSQIIVVSANKVGSGAELTPWVQLLSRNAFGNYRTLLREVSLSPTMGKYLDNVYNRKASSTTSPNENYARELLQLFSVGVWKLNNDGSQVLDGAGQPVPTYNQATIAEFARALTGWTYPTQPGSTPGNSNPEYFVGELLPRTTTHDINPKTLLNGFVTPAQTAGTAATIADLDAVIDNIFWHPNIAPFVATRLIRSLVTSNPSPAYINRVANVFINNGGGVRGDLAAVLVAILMDPEALTPTAQIHGRLKDPVLHVIGFGRALGATIGDPASFQNVFQNLSERVLTPQTVFSFYQLTATLPNQPGVFGPEFQLYPPALAVQRANFIYGIITGQYGSAYAIDRTIFQTVAPDAAALVERHGALTVDRVEATSLTAGRLWLRGERGTVRVVFDLSSAVPPRVQRYDCTSILEPPAAHEAAAREVLAGEAPEIVVARALIGPLALGAASTHAGGDRSTFEVRGERGDAEVTVVLSAGRLESFEIEVRALAQD